MKLFKKKNEKAYKNLIEQVNDVQRGFLIFTHGFTIEQLKNKSGDELCAECGYRGYCAEGNSPECVFPTRRGKETADDNEQ